MSHIIALDQGTTSSRAVLFNKNAEILNIVQKEFRQIFPKSGWVEHDPLEIWNSQRDVLHELMQNNTLAAGDIAALGITNQRETTVIWEKESGKPISNAIVWQDRRTAFICEKLKEDGLGDYIRENTGLIIDAYFSGTKIKWLLDNIPGTRKKAQNGELLFGTIDTWLIWNLTEGKVHATDYSNASRTMLYNIHTLCWDKKLLSALEIPESILPEVKNSSDDYGSYVFTDNGGAKQSIPVCGVAGDQQAALFGQGCLEKGSVKNTYGTGCFMLMNTGEEQIQSASGLLTTIAWGLKGKITYALEGSVFIAGAAIQWLRDGLKIIDSAPISEQLAIAANDDSDVYVVPAFAGLGAPYWDMYARGAIFGLTRDTGQNEIVRATLCSLAYQTKDLIDAMQKDCAIELKNLRVDGGACANNFLMQFQADILGKKVERPPVIESTALGAALFAGIGVGFWDETMLSGDRPIEKTFLPTITEQKRNKLYAKWQKAVTRSMKWADDS
ncbi:MAG: glycerol kinase GlpK [Leptospirales bacterium]